MLIGLEHEIIEKLELTSKELALSIESNKPESVKEIMVIGTLEFIPAKERGDFMDECYRILVPEGKMTVNVPYWNSWRGYFDFRYEWPPFCEQSFLVYNKAWRELNMKGLELKSDFDFTYGYAWEADTASRNDETRSFWTKHYSNAVDALQLVLTKRPE